MRLRSSSRVGIAAIALLLGALAALHPFANVTDPAIESFDKLICPFFLLAPIVAEMPAWRGTPFFVSAIALNALLYAFAVRKVLGVMERRKKSLSRLPQTLPKG